jgi:hypothetical protein
MGRSGRRHNRVAGAMLKSLSDSGDIGSEGWCIGYAHREIGYIGMLKGPLVVDHDGGTFSLRNIFQLGDRLGSALAVSRGSFSRDCAKQGEIGWKFADWRAVKDDVTKMMLELGCSQVWALR